MGSKAPAQTTQINETKLSPQQEEIANLGTKYAKQFASKPLEAPNLQVAGFTPEELEAQQGALTTARGGLQDLVTKAAASNSFLMDPSILSPDSNPYLKAQGDAITGHITQNLQENILPGLRSGSVVAGGMNSGGNTRFGIAEGQAVGRTNNEIATALTNLYSGAYQNGLSTMLGATGQSGQIGQNLLMPSSVIGAVGAQDRLMEQAQLDATAQNQWLKQMLPFIQAEQLMGLTGQMPGGKGVSTVTGAQPSTNPIMGGLGGAASGAALGSMLLPGVGTFIGAGLGGLAGAMS